MVTLTGSPFKENRLKPETGKIVHFWLLVGAQVWCISDTRLICAPSPEIMSIRNLEKSFSSVHPRSFVGDLKSQFSRDLVNFWRQMPTKWLQDRTNGSKTAPGIPPHRAFCGDTRSRGARCRANSAHTRRVSSRPTSHRPHFQEMR
jgi:hypothetical protein